MHGNQGYHEEIFDFRLIKEFIVLINHVYPLMLILLNLIIMIYLSSLKKILICGVKDIREINYLKLLLIYLYIEC